MNYKTKCASMFNYFFVMKTIKVRVFKRVYPLNPGDVYKKDIQVVNWIVNIVQNN